MRKILLAIMLGSLAFNSYAAKPEWAGKEGDKEAKAEQKAKKNSSKEKEGRDGERDHKFVADTETILNGIFSDKEKSVIEDYYNENAASGTGKHKGKKKELPKGLQKKLERGGELPPGWQKKLERGEVLDPELRYHSKKLPDDLLSRLSAEDAANEILRIQDKIIRVTKGQGTIVDMIDLADILTGRGMRKE